MIRIRYQEINEGTELLSKIKTDKLGVLVIRINLIKSVFTVATEVGLEYANGNASSRLKLQKKVKESLKDLGVIFYDEIRLRKKSK